MAIWSQYMRDVKALEGARCPSCLGSGMDTQINHQEGMLICGEGVCSTCNGSGYAIEKAPAVPTIKVRIIRGFIDEAWEHLIKAHVASCTCDVKTDFGPAHGETCRYKHIDAAMTRLNAALAWLPDEFSDMGRDGG